VVSDDTMALMFKPDPMPVDVISALPALDPDVDELVVGNTELIAVSVLAPS
jgi:hypothetical protein